MVLTIYILMMVFVYQTFKIKIIILVITKIKVIDYFNCLVI